MFLCTFAAMKKTHNLIIALLGVIFCAVSCEMPDSGWGGIEGTVRESISGTPVEGVQVRYADTTILTGQDGYYAFNSLPEGLQGITFTKMGFEKIVSRVSVLRDKTVTNDIDISVMRTGWAVGAVDTEFGTIFHTEDAGKNWKRQGNMTSIVESDLFAVCAVNKNVCWAAGDTVYSEQSGAIEFNILKTSDAGNTWRRQGRSISDIAIPLPINAICAMDTSTAWAATAGNIILKGTSGGNYWKKCLQSDVTATFEAISTTDTKHIWAAGIPVGPYLYMELSEDGGETWSSIKIDGLTGEDIVYDISATDSTSLYVSGTFGVLYSSDKGRSWKSVMKQSDAVIGITALGSYDVWAGTADGNIFFTHDGFAQSEKAEIRTDMSRLSFKCISFIGDAVEGAATFISPESTVPGGLLYTDDSGHTWREPESVPYKAALWEVSFAGSRH